MSIIIPKGNDIMSKINCEALACAYNEGSQCQKKTVAVEGVFSRSKLGTFCQSFRNPADAKSFKEELAYDYLDDSMKEATQIGCTANYCAYNENNHCQKKSIEIGNEDAKYRSQTQCDSFKLR